MAKDAARASVQGTVDSAGGSMTLAAAPRPTTLNRETVKRVNVPVQRAARGAATEARRQHVIGPWGLTAIAALIGLAVTGLVLGVQGLHFAYRSIGGHLVLETFDGCAAAAVTVLFYGRYRRTAATWALRMTFAFVILTLTSGYLVVIGAGEEARGPVASIWFPLGARLIAACAVALASVAGSRRVPKSFKSGRLLLGTAAAFVACAIAAALSPSNLPQPIDVTVNPDTSGHLLLIGSGAVQAAQLAHAFVYAVAALAFTARAAKHPDAMLRWLGVGCALAAAARVNYFLFPSLYSQWLYTGDFLRTAFYLALLVGGVRELEGYWSLQADAAVFAERRRLARDLHDGTVQELGYIRVLSRSLVREIGHQATAERIAAAADRALAEARHAIEALSMPLDEPLGDLIRRAAGEIADRYDVDIDVSVDSGSINEAERQQREALVRIVREAVSNAARHGHATHVDIRVHDDCLEISDNGGGFDVQQNGSSGFGLISMRDRAEAMRAHLDISSSPDGGTTVKVAWRGGR